MLKKVLDNPIVYSKLLKNLLPTNFENDLMEMWQTQQPFKNWTVQYNTQLNDTQNRLEPLWKEFCNIPCQIHSKPVTYIYINNSQWAKTEWHNHSQTADIVGVYYVSKNNEIEFKNSSNKIILYKPIQYEMIYFSSKVEHKPVVNKEYRMSINLEGYSDINLFI